MKKRILLLLLLCPLWCLGQTDTLFFNSHKRVKKMEQAISYRLPFIKEGDKFKVVDYYADGQLLSEGYSRSADTLIWDGPYISYHANGNKKETGSLINGYRVGNWKEYDKDGKLFILSSYNPLSDTAEVLRSFYKTGKVKRIEYRVSSKDTTGTCFAEDGTEIPFTPFYNAPSFKGNINIFLGINIRYPDEARVVRADGKVDLIFVVTENGELRNIQTTANSIHPSLTEEAFRVIQKSSGKWNPATLDGIPFPAYYRMPVNFRLE